jgi:hypothetical protein
MKPITLALLAAFIKANPTAKNEAKVGLQRLLPRLTRRLLAITSIQAVVIELRKSAKI